MDKDSRPYITRAAAIRQLASRRRDPTFSRLVKDALGDLEARGMFSSGVTVSTCDELADSIGYRWTDSMRRYQRSVGRDDVFAAIGLAAVLLVLVGSLAEDGATFAGAVSTASTLGAVLFAVWQATRLRQQWR